MLYIRTDMNNTIATGHLMRCFAIAEAARTLGEDTTFILADDNAVEMVTKKVFSYIVLDTTWDDMDLELSALKKVIQEYHISSMLIDSYMVTDSYLKELSTLVKVAYIDDLNSFDYPVDTIICYANYHHKFHWSSAHQIYAGTQYIPMRSEFAALPFKNIPSVIEKLLIISGGTDNYHVIEQSLEVLPLTRYKQIDIICGFYYSRYDEVCSKYSHLDNVHFHYAVSNIVDYMKQADLVISAGGTSLYELCAVGVPTISYSIADNQLDNVRQFQADGIIDYSGDIRHDDVFANINNLLDKYHSDQSLRQKRSSLMQRIVDGKGAIRIAEILCEL